MNLIRKVGTGLAGVLGLVVLVGGLRAEAGGVDTTAVAPSVIAEKATFWLDAADRATLGVDANGDVTNWVSKAGDRRVATYTGGKPTLDETSWGVPTLDFGAVGSQKDMLYTRFTNIRTVFEVIRIANDSRAFLLGDATVNGDTGTYHFHRGNNWYLHSSYTKANALWDGLDPVPNFNSSATPDDKRMQVLCFTTKENANSNSLTRDRNSSVDSGNRVGGRQLAEVIFFSEVLSDSDREAVTTYLMKKWAPALGRKVTGEDYSKSEAGTTYTAGMELTGKLTLAAGSIVVKEASAQPISCATLELAGGTFAYAPFGEGTPTMAATGAATVTGPVTVTLPPTLAAGTYDLVTADSFTVAEGGAVTLAEGAATGADGAVRTLVTTATGLQLTVGARALPAGYTALDWIASTGKQWIDTAVKVFDGMSLDIHFSQVHYVNTTVFFGQDAWAGNRTLLNQQSNNIMFHAGGTTIGKSLADTDYRITVYSGGWVNVSTNALPAITYNASHWFGGVNRTLALFACNTGTYNASYALHRMRIASGDRLVRDFVPCRTPEGEVGLWDWVEQKFYGNKGTDRFYGSDEKVLLLPYLQSNSSQYIDTGYVHAMHDEFTLDANISSSQSQTHAVLFGSRHKASTGGGDADKKNAAYFMARLGGANRPVYCRGVESTALVGTTLGFDQRVTVVCHDDTASWTNADGTTGSVSDPTALTDGFNTICLFGLHEDGGYYYYPTMRLYGFKVVGESTALKRDFRPARAASGQIGVWDAVTGVFRPTVAGEFPFLGAVYEMDGTRMLVHEGVLAEADVPVATTEIVKTDWYDLDVSAVTNYPAFTIEKGRVSFQNGTPLAAKVNGALTVKGGVKLAFDVTPDGFDCLSVDSVVFDESASAENPVVLEVAAPDLTKLDAPFTLVSGGFSASDLAKLKILSNLSVELVVSDAGALVVAPKQAGAAVWTGAAEDGGLWSTARNWQGDPTSVAGANLVFNLSAGGTTAMDFMTGLSVQSLTSGAEAGAFTHAGEAALYVAGGLTNLSTAAQMFAVPVRLGSLDWTFPIRTEGPLVLSNVSEIAPWVTKDGAGELAVADAFLYKTQHIKVNEGTLKIASRGVAPYIACQVKDSNVRIWPNTDLADVFGVRAGCAYGYSWNYSFCSPFVWTNAGNTASVQFQVSDPTYSKESEVLFTQSGNDVIAKVQAWRYIQSYQLGVDWHSWPAASVKVASYVPENIRPVCYNSVPITKAFQPVWKHVRLSEVTGCAGYMTGAAQKHLNKSNGYFWTYDAATDTATVQMQFTDGVEYSKVVMLTLKQEGDLVLAKADAAGYGPFTAYPLGTDMSNPPNSMDVAETPTASGYGICGLRPLPYGDSSGVIEIADGARLDIAAVSNAASLDNVEMTHGKIIRIAGDGPDGKGAIYNSGVTTDGTTYSGPNFGRIELTADASIGGAGRMDIRPLAGSMTAEDIAGCRIEGGHTLTIKDMGLGYFGTLNVTWNLDRLRVEGQMSFETAEQGTITNGVWLADGAWVRTHGGVTIGAGIPFFVEENATVALDIEYAASTVNGAFTVTPGATLTVTNVQNLVLAGAITNEGAVVQTGANTLFLNGPLVGNGSFAGAKVRFGGTTNCWNVTANADGWTSRADFSAVTDPDCLRGLKSIALTYTGDELGDGKVFALAPVGSLTAQEARNIVLSVTDAEGNALTENNYLSIADGTLLVHLGDSHYPLTAVWTGAADDGNALNPANWACTNQTGTVAEGAIPMYYTNVRLDGEVTFNCPSSAAFACESFAANVSLGAACDWRALDLSRLEEGSVIDLKGHDLWVVLAGTPTKSVTFTDSSANATDSGTLHVEVPSGVTLNAGTFRFTGTVKLAKEGAGAWEFPNGTPYVSAGGVSFTAGSMKFTGATELGAGKEDLTARMTSTVLDLNGQTVAVKTINDVGTVVNNAAAAATLVFGRGDTDATLGLAAPANARYRKEGAGVLTVNGTLGTDLDLAGGTVHLQKPAFRHYRFVVLRAYGSTCNSMQFSEFKLLDGETDVTPLRSGFSYTGSAPNQFPEAEAPANAVDGDLGTKYLDLRCANGSYAANKGNVYIQLDYAEPQPITAYNWATANDKPNSAADGRDPADWAILASNNGTDWVTLDKRTGYNATTTRRTWVGPFTVGATTPAVNVTGAKEDAKLVVDGVNLAMNTSVAVGELAFANDGRLSVTGGTVNANVSGAGKVVKTGTGSASMQGACALTVEGGVQVDGGRLAVVPAMEDCKWFRFSVKALESGALIQISELGLYDAKGTRVNLSLTRVNTLEELAPGRVWASNVGQTGSGQVVEKLFDNSMDANSKWCFTSPTTPTPSDPSTWLVVVMRLPNAATPVASYNMATAGDSGKYYVRNPTVWSLEASADGVNWATIDEKALSAGPHANNTWYNGGTPYKTSGVPSVPLTGTPSLGTVGVAAGAELVVPPTLAASGVRANWTTNGTVAALQLISKGKLELVNVPADPPSEFAVPFATGNLSGSVKNWRVTMNGEEHTELMVFLRNGTLYVGRKGLTLYVR